MKTHMLKMYNKGNITYGDIDLKADRVAMDWERNLLSAQGAPDTTGKIQGKPIFKEGDQTYVTDDILYNFKSKKALIKGVVTQQGEAYMHGKNIMKTETNDLLVDEAKYTTCDLAHPHYYISAHRIKVIPNDKVLSGPFDFVLKDVPTPFFFPFGIFPSPRKKASGVLFPTYGEERRRGFFLKDGGYYWAINDYIDVAVRGEIYSKGSMGFSVASNYKKRYAYNGNFSFRFNRQKIGESETDSLVQKDFWIRWTHSPQSKGTGRFSASVNAGSSSFNQNNPTNDYNQLVNTTFNSSVSYSNVIAGTPFNYAISARHNQNVRTGEINFQLPEFALNMNRIYPLKKLGSGSGKWYQKLNIGYNFNASNQVTNKLSTDSIAPLNFETLPTLLKKANNGGVHRATASTSFNVLKFLTISPSFNYTDYWYLREIHHSYSDSLKTVVRDTVRGFSRAGEYSTGISANTRIYGTYYFKGNGPIKAVRHMMTPSISLNYKPDFSDPKYGYYETVQSDSLGNTQMYSKYEGFLFGSPNAGQSASIGFSLNNQLSMKIKTKKDTTDTPRKVNILDNLSFSTSYNILADSFKLAPISFNARTRVFNNKVDISINGTLNPYVMVLDSTTTNAKGVKTFYQHTVDEFTWANGKGIGRITAANLSLSTNLNPKGRNRDQDLKNKAADNPNIDAEELANIQNNPESYVDFSIPWNLRISYNLRYSKDGYKKADITQTTQFSGDVNLSEKWKIGFRSGFDFEKKQFTQTSFDIYRDLHCWQINASWVPFGRYQSFSVDLRAKASILQDLKLSRRRSWWDR